MSSKPWGQFGRFWKLQSRHWIFLYLEMTFSRSSKIQCLDRSVRNLSNWHPGLLGNWFYTICFKTRLCWTVEFTIFFQKSNRIPPPEFKFENHYGTAWLVTVSDIVSQEPHVTHLQCSCIFPCRVWWWQSMPLVLSYCSQFLIDGFGCWSKKVAVTLLTVLGSHLLQRAIGVALHVWRMLPEKRSKMPQGQCGRHSCSFVPILSLFTDTESDSDAVASCSGISNTSDTLDPQWPEAILNAFVCFMRKTLRIPIPTERRIIGRLPPLPPTSSRPHRNHGWSSKSAGLNGWWSGCCWTYDRGCGPYRNHCFSCKCGGVQAWVAMVLLDL